VRIQSDVVKLSEDLMVVVVPLRRNPVAKKQINANHVI
jgi:hypothetical protein